MKGLNETISELSSLSAKLIKLRKSGSFRQDGTTDLSEVSDFGSNPGNLRMLTKSGRDVSGRRPLVVALHGCTQTAADYDYGSGWSALAEAMGFAILFPEQRRSNNPNNCFNWFSPAQTRRGSGEALSIAQMVEHMIAHQGVDRQRVFVVGLSAGGAMAASMLAAYPEMFAGGAVIAGLPHGAAANVQEALRAMGQSRQRPATEWGDLVRSASRHEGRWPKLSVWHGSSDSIVHPGNMEEAIKQWTDVHGLLEGPAETRSPQYSRRVWRDAAGDDVVEAVFVSGMNHGVPIATSGPHSYGNASAYHFDVGISSSHHIAGFWGIADAQVAQSQEVSRPVPVLRRAAANEPALMVPTLATVAEDKAAGHGAVWPRPLKPFDPRVVIEKTLRSVGLIKD